MPGPHGKHRLRHCIAWHGKVIWKRLSGVNFCQLRIDVACIHTCRKLVCFLAVPDFVCAVLQGSAVPWRVPKRLIRVPHPLRHTEAAAALGVGLRAYATQGGWLIGQSYAEAASPTPSQASSSTNAAQQAVTVVQSLEPGTMVIGGQVVQKPKWRILPLTESSSEPTQTLPALL